MAMPKRRRRMIVVRNRSFNYALLNGGGRYDGQSDRTIRLVLELASGIYQTLIFASKKWGRDKDGNPILELLSGDFERYYDHRVAFTPDNVRQVIERVLDLEAAPQFGFEVGDWRLERVVTKVRKSKKAMV